jgi:hypothetical protein
MKFISKIFDSIFGPESEFLNNGQPVDLRKKVNSLRRIKNMENHITQEDAFQCVFQYRLGIPAQHCMWPKIKLSETQEAHAQQVRRLNAYIQNKDIYMGIRKPLKWFYVKAFDKFGFVNLDHANAEIKEHNFTSRKQVCEFMFSNKYSSIEEYKLKTLF